MDRGCSSRLGEKRASGRPVDRCDRPRLAVLRSLRLCPPSDHAPRAAASATLGAVRASGVGL